MANLGAFLEQMQMSSTLRLHDGHTVELAALVVERFYAGVMEGLPNEEQTASMREGFRKRLEKLWWERKAQEIEPQRFQAPPPPPSHPQRGQRFFIPPVAVGALLKSGRIVEGDHDAMGSTMVLIWHQLDYRGLPFPPAEVVAQIRWDEFAENWSW